MLLCSCLTQWPVCLSSTSGSNKLLYYHYYYFSSSQTCIIVSMVSRSFHLVLIWGLFSLEAEGKSPAGDWKEDSCTGRFAASPFWAVRHVRKRDFVNRLWSLPDERFDGGLTVRPSRRALRHLTCAHERSDFRSHQQISGMLVCNFGGFLFGCQDVFYWARTIKGREIPPRKNVGWKHYRLCTVKEME